MTLSTVVYGQLERYVLLPRRTGIVSTTLFVLGMPEDPPAVNNAIPALHDLDGGPGPGAQNFPGGDLEPDTVQWGADVVGCVPGNFAVVMQQYDDTSTGIVLVRIQSMTCTTRYQEKFTGVEFLPDHSMTSDKRCLKGGWSEKKSKSVEDLSGSELNEYYCYTVILYFPDLVTNRKIPAPMQTQILRICTFSEAESSHTTYTVSIDDKAKFNCNGSQYNLVEQSMPNVRVTAHVGSDDDVAEHSTQIEEID